MLTAAVRNTQPEPKRHPNAERDRGKGSLRHTRVQRTSAGQNLAPKAPSSREFRHKRPLRATHAGAVSVGLSYRSSRNRVAQFIMSLQRNFKTCPSNGTGTMIELKQKFDASTVAVLRQALNEVVTDRRFLNRKSVTPLEVAEHILQQAASGERDLNRLKSSAFERLGAAA
jgi:hypothetical protein